MKYLRSGLGLLLVITLTLTISACSAGNILKRLSGGSIDVDKDGNVKIEGEDGGIQIGQTQWDSSAMHGLDAPEEAVLGSYLKTDDSATFIFEKMPAEKAMEYVAYLKSQGFTYNSVVLNDHSFTGTNKEGHMISFIYAEENQGGSISATKTDPPSEEDNKEATFGSSTVKTWDSSLVGGAPDPGTEITNYWSSDGDVTYTFNKLDNHLDYVEKLKSVGFSKDPSTIETNGSFYYRAMNSNGDEISFTNAIDDSKDTGSLSFVKKR